MELATQIGVMAAAGILAFLGKSREAALWSTGMGMAALFLVSLFFRYRREKGLKELTAYLMRLQDSPEIPELKKYGEGQLGILQSEIYKLAADLGGRSDTAKREKKYLADMLSDISHQIKTPLAAISIMSDLLKEPGLSEEKRMEFAANIDKQAGRITWLIKNLLVLSRLEAGVLKLKKETISVKELLDRVLSPFSVMAEVKEVSLTAEVPEDIFLTCDIHWTTEALSNIVKNCLEHTGPGGRVSVKAGRNNFSVNISVCDNGEGISREALPHIFERFYKAPSSGNSSVGIGLSMSRQIFLLQGGTVGAESREGEGTRFLVKLYQSEH